MVFHMLYVVFFILFGEGMGERIIRLGIVGVVSMFACVGPPLVAAFAVQAA